MIASELKVISRYLLVILSMIALYVASQGLSILYLFLLADLLCCAAAFPVFFGFYSQRYQSYQAIIGILRHRCRVIFLPSAGRGRATFI